MEVHPDWSADEEPMLPTFGDLVRFAPQQKKRKKY
jgi:hypothetical protein